MYPRDFSQNLVKQGEQFRVAGVSQCTKVSEIRVQIPSVS